jgi:hypothetical protein
MTPDAEASTPRKAPRRPTDRQIERMKQAERKAGERHDAACERCINEVHAVHRKHQPKKRAAEVALRNARAALEIAELAQRGIIPMHTVVMRHGALWVVRIAPQGWPRLVPLKADLTPHKGRSETHMPRRRYDLTVTDKVMKT